LAWTANVVEPRPVTFFASPGNEVQKAVQAENKEDQAR
jgi:hypothetical protein